MIWPGMGDPTKRKKTLKFLAITAIIGISVGLASSIVQGQLAKGDPLKACINEMETPYVVTSRLELYVDGEKAAIPANIGRGDGQCHRSLYTLTDDGTIYAEWTEVYPFEIGHFLWVWDFPMRDMQQEKSRIVVNGMETDEFIHHKLQDGNVYRAEFVSKAYDDSKDKDFAPPGPTL